MKINAWLAVALAGLVIGFGARATLADSVFHFDTGTGTNWQVDTSASTDIAPSGAAVNLAPSNPSALPASVVDSYYPGATAQWIGVRSDGGTIGYYGDYTFSLTINYSDFVPPVTGTPPQSFEISGVFSVDNEVTSLYLEDTHGNSYAITPSLLLDDAGAGSSQAYSFQRVFGIGDGGLTLYDPLTLVVVVHNDYPASTDPTPSPASMSPRRIPTIPSA